MTNPPIISLKDIHKQYDSLEVLKGVDLFARPGEVVSIIGSSGSGKSTLLRCANLLEKPTSGEISFQGTPIALTPTPAGLDAADPHQLRWLRSRLGMVFQQFNLWQNKTILHNVMEAPLIVQKRPRDEVHDEAMTLLEKVGIASKADSYPTQLSGGQQQRAAIARALAIKPEVMLFDEPTSALDPELEQEVLRVIRALAEEGRTMLLVTHNMNFARDVSHRVIFLEKGRIDHEDVPEQLFGSPRSDRLQKFLQATAD